MIKRIRKAIHEFPALIIVWDFFNKKQYPNVELERGKCAALRLRNKKSYTT